MVIFLSSLWLIRTFASISIVLYYWQLKEYRWDRLKEFLIRQKGHQVFFSVFHFLILTAVILYFFLSFLPRGDTFFSIYFPLIITVLFLAETLQFFHHIILRRFKRPRLTMKAFLIFFFTFSFLMLLFWILFVLFGSDMSFITLALIFSLVALVEHDVNAFCVMAFNALTRSMKKRLYLQARAKRVSYPGLKVIGITGSFGKSSVKEYIYHILKKDFQVLKTKKNINTEIGIAKTIINDLRDYHEIFVCEMGAYRKGEIKQCCFMTNPDIALFTGLNEQHLALFGSLDKTFAAKWELMDSLPDDGIALFNTDSMPLKDRLLPLPLRSILCSTGSENHDLSGIRVQRDKLHFTYHGQNFEASLLGRFQIVNLLMAITVAMELGMSLESIAERVADIEPLPKTIHLKLFSRGSIIDDSYNVNPDGIRAALDHLHLFKGAEKVIFFPGILELGPQSEMIHEQLGEYIAARVDYAFFFDDNYSDAIMAGALKNGLARNHIFLSKHPHEMIEIMNEILKKHSQQKFVILFESRGAEKVMNAL